MIIKVCGIKYQDNLDQLVTTDIDMIGLNFYKPSPRFLEGSLDVGGEIRQSLVGVFVDESYENIISYCRRYHLRYVQLHGHESPELCNKVSREIPVIKAFSIAKPKDFEKTNRYSQCAYFLFDTKTKDHGGSGKKFSWQLLEHYNGDTPFILAGGIGFEDVAEILKISHPKFSGVDINSKFEIRPGEKDISLVKEFSYKLKSIKSN